VLAFVRLPGRVPTVFTTRRTILCGGFAGTQVFARDLRVFAQGGGKSGLGATQEASQKSEPAGQCSRYKRP